MIKKRGWLILACLISLFDFARGQSDGSLVLRTCQDWALAQVPIKGQRSLLEQAAQLKIEELDAQRLPSIYWRAKGTLQSETISLPFVIPGQEEAFSVPLANAQTTLEVQYRIYDGGLTEASQNLEQAKLAKDLQSVEVALYPVKEQVQKVYFGILLLEAQAKVLENTLADLAQRRQNLEAAAQHGVVLPINIRKLEVEAIKLTKKKAELSGERKSLLALLGDLIGRPLSEEVELEVPAVDLVPFNQTSQRPELALLDRQKQILLEQSKLVELKNRPQLSAFLQAGVGYANPLNFFDTDVSPFAIGGLNFQWKIWDGKQVQKRKDWLSIQSQLIENQKENFHYQQNLLDRQYRERAQKLQVIIEQDRQHIRLQNEIIAQVNAQLAQGVITATEYITELNQQTNAQLELALHELQLQEIQVQYLTQKGIW